MNFTEINRYKETVCRMLWKYPCLQIMTIIFLNRTTLEVTVHRCVVFRNLHLIWTRLNLQWWVQQCMPSYNITRFNATFNNNSISHVLVLRTRIRETKLTSAVVPVSIVTSDTLTSKWTFCVSTISAHVTVMWPNSALIDIYIRKRKFHYISLHYMWHLGMELGQQT